MTSKGSCYQLVGSADVDTMRLKGFPEYLIPYFVEGFPQTWKQLLERHFGGSTTVSSYHGATGPHSSRSEGLLRPNPVSLNTEGSIEEYGGLETLSSSSLSGSTYINSAISPESPGISTKPQVGARSVYSSGSSLFLNRKFGNTVLPTGVSSRSEDSDTFRLEDAEENIDDDGDSTSGGENENGIGRITESGDTDLEKTPVSAKATRIAGSATGKGSESDDLVAGMRFGLDADSDGSEELGVAPPKVQVVVTPRRHSRVAGPASGKKVDQSDSVDDDPPTADSAGETDSGRTPLKTPRSATPKWKAGRRYFRYKEPETPSTSVTRSGRKVRKPQDWWANAQEHLDGSGNADGSAQKESKIKYKWGSGEAVVVQDGKRVRLSDFYLQGGDDDALFRDSGEDKTKSMS
ncbi:hypothetical protein LPJ53_005793 [Coemansia erecta]|uniref:SANTA domain-containing protein n=1 Tax=Coemansia erecta TaxID=147472 RepID=A0A9W8CQ41_9FUNG|nr:hypothetical protein LPJ53_005793 [Coemansia erecta]